MSKPTALITGASAGIGAELAQVFAENGHNLVLTARREDRLDTLADALRRRCDVDVIALDLARRKGPHRLLDALDALDIEVDVLVNNAGVATSGPFQQLAADEVQTMLRLNTQALVGLTHALLPGMIARGRGRILNLASVAAFQAVPGLALYSATKAFVLSFTEGLSEDLRGTGVTVTALCPGLTRTDMVDDIGPPQLAGPFLAKPRDVALEGYRACMAGEVIRVPGIINQALVSWVQHQPRWLVRWYSGIAARQTFGSGRSSGQDAG